MRARIPILAFSIALAISTPTRLQSHITSPDDCDASGSPPQVGGNLDEPSTSLRWESDAADLGGGVICFDRFIRNRHKANKLIFDWPPGNMAAPNGVPPEKEMHYNVRLVARDAIVGGPLYYGPGAAPPLDTQVYREMSGQTQARVLTSHVAFWVFDEKGEPIEVDIVFTSSVFQAGGRRIFRYAARNKTTAPVHFLWASARSAAFDKSLASLQAANREFRFGPIKDAIRLPAESTFVVTADEFRQPELRVSPMIFFSKSGKPIAQAPGLALVPVKGN